MAFGDNITLNSSKLAGALSDIIKRKAYTTAIKTCPFLVAALGNLSSEPGQLGPVYEGAVKRMMSGREGSFLMRKAAPTFTGVALASSFDSVSVNGTLDLIIRPKFDLAHRQYNHWEAYGNLEALKGENAVLNYAEAISDFITDGIFTDLATQFNGTGDQTESTVGSWRLATDANDNTSTYLGIARADSSNVNLRGLSDATSGAITYQRLRTKMNEVRANCGKPDIVIMSAANYTKLQNDLQSLQYVTTTNNAYSHFGWNNFMFDGATVVLDSHCSDNYVGVLDSSTWQIWFDNKTKVESDGRFPLVKSGVPFLCDYFAAIVCTQPNRNGKIYVNA